MRCRDIPGRLAVIALAPAAWLACSVEAALFARSQRERERRKRRLEGERLARSNRCGRWFS